MRKNNILLFGLGGAGKTVSTVSLAKIKGMKLRYLVTDNNAVSGILRGLKFYKITPEPGQIIVMQPFSGKDNKSIFIQSVLDHRTYLKQSTEDAYKSKVDSNHRTKYGQFLSVQQGLVDFMGKDLATGEIVNCGNLGDVEKWDSSCIFIVDGLTTIAKALTDETLAGRKDFQQQDYNSIQNKAETFIYQLTTFSNASIVLLAHAKIADQELTGQETISVAVPGTALSGKLTGYFTNSIYQEINKKGERVWQGVSSGRRISISVRDIPEKEDLIPDFSRPEYTFFNEEFL